MTCAGTPSAESAVHEMQDALGLTQADYKRLVTTAEGLWLEKATTQRKQHSAHHHQLLATSTTMQKTLQGMAALRSQGLLSDAAYSATAAELEQKIRDNREQTACLQRQIDSPLLSAAHEKDARRYILETVGQGCKQFLPFYDCAKRARHSL